MCEKHFLSEKAQRSGKAGKAREIKILNNRLAQCLLSNSLREARQNLHHVRNVLLSHGDLILSRWRKQSRVKRAKLLNTAAPRFFEPPSGNATENADPWASRKVIHEAIPGMETHGFSQDYMRLMSLLHVRSQCDPSEWAAFDIRSTKYVCSQSTWNPYIYNGSAVVMHGEQYGRVVDFDADSAHVWRQAGYPRAIMVFEVQHAVAKMLRDVVDSIVADAEPTGNFKWTAMLSKGLRSAHEEALWSPYLNQEFAAPATLDMDVILEKVRNQLNVLVDETELMQTNPDYMRQCIRDAKANTFILFATNKNNQYWIDKRLAMLAGNLVRSRKSQDEARGKRIRYNSIRMLD
jgi:hypothetical protein